MVRVYPLALLMLVLAGCVTTQPYDATDARQDGRPMVVEQPPIDRGERWEQDWDSDASSSSEAELGENVRLRRSERWHRVDPPRPTAAQVREIDAPQLSRPRLSGETDGTPLLDRRPAPLPQAGVRHPTNGSDRR